MEKKALSATLLFATLCLGAAGLQSPAELDSAALRGNDLEVTPGSSSSQESASLSIRPHGVRVEVEETIDGETTSQIYEAESLEELLETYPELRNKIHTSSSLPGTGDPFGSLGIGNWPNLDHAFPWRLQNGHSTARPRLDVLGVRMIEPASRQDEYPDVAPELGLQVVEVLRGSLAEAVGIRPGDLVLTIGETPIQSAADARRALATQSLEREIEIQCARPDGSRKIRRWVPDEGREQLQREDLGRRLRKSGTQV